MVAYLAWFCEITPDCKQYGGWPGNDDHSTNWCDAAQHPGDESRGIDPAHLEDKKEYGARSSAAGAGL